MPPALIFSIAPFGLFLLSKTVRNRFVSFLFFLSPFFFISLVNCNHARDKKTVKKLPNNPIAREITARYEYIDCPDDWAHEGEKIQDNCRETYESINESRNQLFVCVPLSFAVAVRICPDLSERILRVL